MFSKIFKTTLQHKLITGIILLVIVAGGYFGYQWLAGDENTTQYIIAAVEKGTLIVSISGSGQVSASNQVDVKPKASGEITGVYVMSGQEIGAGTLLAAIDARGAERAVRDAETSLETAKLELDKLLEPLDELTLLQAESALIQAKDNLTKLKFTQESKHQDALDTIKKAEDNIKKAYEDGFNAVANAFLDLPNVMAGLQDILFGTSFGSSQWNLDYYSDAVKSYDKKVIQYQDDASNAYQTARKVYDQNFADYKSTSRFSDIVTIEKLIDQTYETSKSIAESVKNANNLIQFYQDKLTERNLKPNSLSNTHLSSLNTYTGKTNSHVSGLLSIKRSIQDNKETKLNAERSLTEINQNNPLDLAAAERSVKEREESLVKLKTGPDDFDIRAKKITIRQREDALTTAKQTLADHYVRTPFAGVIAKVNAKKGDSASAGTAIATLVTKQKIAEISLNEVDVAKIKVGQKATLTFDAVEGLSITGEVAEIDSLGTVAQGVVTYAVKIVFDTQDERVKSGMSVSAAIITDAKQDTLMVPNSAVKSQGDAQYVEILVDNISQSRPVEIGLSNDTMTEITSGLKEGDKVVTQTITSSASQTQSQSSSSLRIPGLGGGGMR
ncbi:MAG: hypothetical protein LiPW39_148 [Parcubacteria group bacterium LiPW_39]|nr:MAG: hypothetical protein LiPW39_148 [Parcubacteria group bacterium LiPW_39]